jgi:hypothetical protein
MEKKFKVRLNSVDKVEALLQEIYDDSLRQMTLIQDRINEIEQSTTLADETIDTKAKYAKLMHDYITDKEKAIGRKLDVSRLMTEVLKQNGDVDAVISDKQITENLDDAFGNIRDLIENTVQEDIGDDKPEIYITNKS